MVGMVVRLRAVMVVVLWLQGSGLVAAQTVETTSITPSTFYGASHALLIGINKYPKLPADVQLRYAVQDVSALRDLLIQRYGFPRANIRILTDSDATRSNIERALAGFADTNRVKPNDRILIYFSGHGQTVRLPTGTDMGFLIPTDADIDLNDSKNAGPFLATCLRMDTVWGYLEASPAKHTLVLADACYSGLLTKSRGGRRRLSPKELSSLRAMQVITAGDQGQRTIEDSAWGHGAFTYKLLEELKARATTSGTVFTASELHVSLAKSVSDLTHNGQTPLIGSYKSEDGDFLFVTTGGPEVPIGRAILRVATTPEGARVFIDNVEQQGIVSPAEIEINLGSTKSKKVEVAAELAGYKIAVQTATLQSGREVAIAPIVLQSNGSGIARHKFDWSARPEAARQYAAALQSSPNDYALLMDAAEFQRKIEHNYPEAERTYIRASVMNPKSALPLTYIGELYTYCFPRNSLVAMDWYNKAIQADPTNALPYHQLADHLSWFGNLDWPKAEKLYRKAITLNPNLAESYENLGWIYLNRKKDPVTASELFAQGHKAEPRSVQCLLGLASIRLERKDYKGAESYYRQAADIADPINMNDAFGGNFAKSDAQTALGTLLLDIKKDYPAAEQRFRRALDLNSANADAKTKLARAIKLQSR